MKRLDDANLTIEPSKCQFLQREASFLGHITGNGKIRPDPKKIEAVRNFPVPTSKKKIKQFLGLAGYYRRFVEDSLAAIKSAERTLSYGRAAICMGGRRATGARKNKGRVLQQACLDDA